MSTLSIDVTSRFSNIPIGRVAENEVTAVAFDISSWIEEYGDGSATLAIQRPTDDYPYIVAMTIEDGITTWTISDTDTAIQGLGKVQLTYYADDKVKKSQIYITRNAQSLTGEGDTPDAYDEWLETLQALTAETETNATAAASSASAAATSEANAATSESNAAASESAAATSESNASASATAAAESATEAAESAELAAQHAATSGWAWFSVNTEDGNAYVTVSDDLSDEVTFSVNTATGELEVVINE